MNLVLFISINLVAASLIKLIPSGITCKFAVISFNPTFSNVGTILNLFLVKNLFTKWTYYILKLMT